MGGKYINWAAGMPRLNIVATYINIATKKVILGHKEKRLPF